MGNSLAVQNAFRLVGTVRRFEPVVVHLTDDDPHWGEVDEAKALLRDAGYHGAVLIDLDEDA